MNTKDLTAVFQWLENTIPTIEFGQITLTIVRHNNKTKFIEKKISVKEQINEYRIQRRMDSKRNLA